MKGKKQTIGTIKGIDIVRHRSVGYQPAPFRTGRHMTEKDRPRDKSYKKYAL